MSPDRDFYDGYQEANPSSSEVAAWAAAMISITEKESPKKGNGFWFYCKIEIGDQTFLGKLWISPFSINEGTIYIPLRDNQGGAMEVFATRNKKLMEGTISGEEHFERLLDSKFDDEISDSDGSIVLSICSADDYDLVSVEMGDNAAGPLRYEPFKPGVLALGVATRFEKAFPGSKIKPLSLEEIKEIRHTLQPQLVEA